MPNTPVYGWRYQALTDSPDGAALGQNLGLDIEATVAALASRVAQTEASISVLQTATIYSSRQTLGVAAPTVTFNNIPTNLRSLRLVWTARGDVAANSTSIVLKVNNNAGALYDHQYIQGANAVAPTSTFQVAGTNQFLGFVAATTSVGIWSSGIVDFQGWDLTTTPHGSYLGNLFRAQNVEIAAAGNVSIQGVGAFAGAGPYTRLDFSTLAGNFIVGSDFLLEGLYT